MEYHVFTLFCDALTHFFSRPAKSRPYFGIVAVEVTWTRPNNLNAKVERSTRIGGISIWNSIFQSSNEK
jgi:hypothetical protein